MHLEKIPHRMTLTDFRKVFPAGKIREPKQSDYDESLWEEMKLNFFANFTEDTSAGEILYQLTFRREILSFLQLNINGDFNEEGYSKLAGVAREIIALGALRDIGAPVEQSPLLAWKDLIQSPLPDSGRPEDRFISVLNATWKPDGYKVTLRYDWTWPGQLYLEYREEIC